MFLYNYSSSNCDDSPSVYRFDSKYNNKCFKIIGEADTENSVGNGGMLYLLNRRFLQQSGDQQDGVFIFSYECPKNNLVDCSNIDLLSDDNFPPQCDDTALNIFF